MIKIVELDPAQSVQREHLLVKVRVDNATRSQVLEAVNLFRARVVDVATDALVIEVTGDSGKTTRRSCGCSSPTASRSSPSRASSPSGRGVEVASPNASSRTRRTAAGIDCRTTTTKERTTSD